MHHVPLPPTQLVLTLSMSSSEMLLKERWSNSHCGFVNMVLRRKWNSHGFHRVKQPCSHSAGGRHSAGSRRTFNPLARGLLSSEDSVDCASSPRGAAYARGVRRSLQATHQKQNESTSRFL